MTILLMLVGMVFLVYFLFKAVSREAPAPVFWFILALIAGLGYLLYLNADVFVALWTGIKNLPNAIKTFFTDSWDEFWNAMTGWAWLACCLFLGAGLTVGYGGGWLSGRALRAVQTGRLTRELEQALERATTAEQAAAQDREAAEMAESLMRSAERRAQGLTGQIASAVQLADDRGTELREIREKNRAEKAGLSTQADIEQGDIEQDAQTANGRHKKPRGTRGNKRSGKGRLPKK